MFRCVLTFKTSLSSRTHRVIRARTRAMPASRHAGEHADVSVSESSRTLRTGQGRSTRRRSVPGEGTGRSISRVLSGECDCSPAGTIIHLGLVLPRTSSDQPGCSGGQPSNTSCSTLHRMGFAEPPQSPEALVVSYTTVSPLPAASSAAGGLFSVALACGFPRVGVTHHPALWSPDFPRRADSYPL